MTRSFVRVGLTALVGLAALGLAACGPGPSGPPGSASPIGSVAPPPAASMPSVPGSVAPSPPAASSETPAPQSASIRCTSADLTIRVEKRPDELSAHRLAVLWTNRSARPCSMTGFAGADLQGPDDPTFGPTYQLRRSNETPSTVSVPPNASAESIINVLSPDAPGPSWTPTTMLVTPPDETHSTPLPWIYGPVLRQDGATRPGTFLHPVTPAVGATSSPPAGGPAPCTSGQVRAAMTGLDAAAGNRYASLTLSVAPGQPCQLASPVDVALRDAGDLAIRRESAGTTLTLGPDQPAFVTLHWTVAADRRSAPRAVTVRWPGGAAEVPWSGGPVDDAPARHEIAVGPLTAGAPPH